ncbi:hypothetical protein LC087_12745 [Bacillus carboniphilus]|uniref:DUF3397 domain-containing protein n=1 Tax=Bacillus carboniphilus TaxID=86663 RepID=A0ABY9JQX2_9BACI|nr:hypothetical protein [Bacillus carboniphilus]WLR41727.1 hypothetical protein LC087_12745 [Bacillus carboniphilus]
MIKSLLFLIITLIVSPSLIKWSYKGDIVAKILGYSIAFFFVAVNFILGAEIFFDYHVDDYIIWTLMIMLPISIFISMIIKYFIGDEEDKKIVRFYFLFILGLFTFVILFGLFLKYI